LLAELADIEARLGRTLTPDEANAVTELIGDVSGLAAAYCRRDFGLHVDDTIELAGWAERKLELPGKPVRLVSSVTIDGETVDWILVDSSLWRVWGWQKRLGSPIPSKVVVTYTHGSDEVPADVKGVVCNEVMRNLGATPGMSSEQLGDHAVTWSAESGSVALSKGAKISLSRFRRKTGSTPLRRP
jgi:hypothetical protein